MLIIIEGMDKTGKSTLSEYLLKNLPRAYYMKNGFRPKDGSEVERNKIVKTYSKLLDVYLENFKDSILILDRFLISEYVYSYKRGYEAINSQELKYIRDRLEKIDDVIMIYCKTDKTLIAENFKKDKEDFVDVSEINELCKRYDKYIIEDNIRVPIITYDYTISTPKKVCQFIVNKVLVDAFLADDEEEVIKDDDEGDIEEGLSKNERI